MKSNVLVIDDNRDILTAARILLSQNGFDVTTEPDPRQIPFLIRKTDYSVILLDMNYTKGIVHGREGIQWLDIILEINPTAVVILITAYGDVELAVEGMRKGASDFVQKPWDNQKLVSTVSMAAELHREKRKSSRLKSQNKLLNQNFKNIIGSCEPMKAVFNLVEKVAGTDANVLITGENGTGKDLIARIIHEKSERADSIFLGVDMGSIPESLFESEMFGHETGAFTGADTSRIGRIEAASGGTLFLDEIGNIPLGQQPKLLRVLETREVVPLGNGGKRSFNVRLICATNGNIQELVRTNLFRQDLLYRINTVEIAIPPLRERKEDIPLLLEHFLSIYTKKYNRKELRIHPSAIEKLKQYSWPGNVRELSHLVERAVILTDKDIIEINDFSLTKNEQAPCFSDFNLEKMEKNVIKEAILSEEGNLSKTSVLLGITRATLYRKMEKYDL